MGVKYMNLKRITFVLIILIFPIFISAKEKDNSCEVVNTNNEKTIIINIKQEIKNKANNNSKDINKFKFDYKIMDLEGNVLDRATNDENGNITFSCFDVKSSDIGNYKLYKIIMEDNENTPFDYDPYTIYFSLRPNTTNGLFDPIIAFYKDDGDDSPERYGTTYKGKVFHATEEELQGQAYAVIDRLTGVMTFFRDEPGKYTNKQEDGSKIYYTGFEEYDGNFAWDNGWIYQHRVIDTVKKIVFKDAIKPNKINGWFEELYELEEIDISKLDTSLIKSLNGFLKDSHKLKKIDISTMDTRKVKDLSFAFKYSGIEYIDFNYWSFESLNNGSILELLSGSTNLKYLNISNFNMKSSSAEFGNLVCLEKIVIGDDYDFYSANFHNPSPSQWYNPEKNKSYTGVEIRDNLYYGTESMAGYYIRPMCTTTASFKVNYNVPESKQSTDIIDDIKTDELGKVSDSPKNPETRDMIIAVISLMVISLIIVICLYKNKESKHEL